MQRHKCVNEWRNWMLASGGMRAFCCKASRLALCEKTKRSLYLSFYYIHIFFFTTLLIIQLNKMTMGSWPIATLCCGLVCIEIKQNNILYIYIYIFSELVIFDKKNSLSKPWVYILFLFSLIYGIWIQPSSRDGIKFISSNHNKLSL